ncbi:MAG: DUF4180 domain-containing protein [Proteobacteria bacterium]|nr:DUF4180 domain-containing protein [Pseudomonadota bacterium]
MTELIEIETLRVLSFHGDEKVIRVAGDANDFIADAWAHHADLLAIPLAQLGPDFLKLSTGVAGEVFQKFVNYRLRCAIVGDIAAELEASKALRDFVRETNEGKSIWFVPDLDALRARLAGKAA